MKKIYEAITKVSKALSRDGISKSRNNQAQGYAFRGIDDVYNALAPILADAGLCILPQVVERVVVERINAKGTALFYVTVKVDFAFVAAEDASEHHIITYGEAMDSGDKATNKAMSAAYKYAAMQAFCIPTEGDNDADAHTHEVSAHRAPSHEELASVSARLEEAARGGLNALQTAWAAIPNEAKVALKDLKEKLKHTAADFDAQRKAA